jgi:hypothetical protein
LISSKGRAWAVKPLANKANATTLRRKKLFVRDMQTFQLRRMPQV